MSDAPSQGAVERQEPPFLGSERELLEGWLGFHRATLLLKIEGLSADQLRERSAPPSTLSLLGLIRHLTDVERNWFRRALGEDVRPVYETAGVLGGDFDGVEAADAAADVARYIDEVEQSRRTAAQFGDLDTVAHGRRDGREVALSLRWVYLHMIEEYARHNGHADLLRERLDGTTGV